jgi:hypothetical protein
VRFLFSFVLQTLLFGSLDALLFANGSSQPATVITVFVLLELGVMASLCSLIIDQFQESRLSGALKAVVVGFVASHAAILAALRIMLPFSLDEADISAHGTLAWMKLTMEVGLVVILLATSVAMLNPRASFRSTSSTRTYTTN